MKSNKYTTESTKQLLQDLKQLVEIPSVRDMTTARASAPFGEAIRHAMDVFLQLAQREGFIVRDFDGYAVDAQLGEGDDYIGVLAHLDVVEAGERAFWHSDPFQMREENGMLSSGTPEISNNTRPGFTTATQYSGAPFPCLLYTSTWSRSSGTSFLSLVSLTSSLTVS